MRENAISALAARGTPDQIGVVVRDLKAAIHHYSIIGGIEGWRIYALGPSVFEECLYDGRRVPHVTLVAITGKKPQIELIQPISGPSVHFDFLDRHGEGLHHLGFYTRDLESGITEMKNHDYAVLQAAVRYKHSGRGGYAYFDTEEALGVVVELIEWPDPPILPIELAEAEALTRANSETDGVRSEHA